MGVGFQHTSQATLARAVVAAHGVEATAAAMGPAQGRAVMHLLGGAPDDAALNAEVGVCAIVGLPFGVVNSGLCCGPDRYDRRVWLT